MPLSNYTWGNSSLIHVRILSPPFVFGRDRVPESGSLSPSATSETSIAASEGSVTGDSKHFPHPQERGQRPVTIHKLTDDALLEIFDFCRDIGTSEFEEVVNEDPTWWETLVHVCRRWRNIIFASSRRLDLHVACSCRTPTITTLDIWPPFPITIWDDPMMYAGDKGIEDIVAEHHDRIDEIIFTRVTGSTLERFITATQEPLVALTNLRLESSKHSRPGTILPEGFFSGSAPSLRSFSSSGISFPSLPNFVRSARDLVNLQLEDIPTSGYISPGAIVASLTAIPNLNRLSIGFRYPQQCPILGNPPPPPRAVFPALTFLSFQGISRYLENLVARIDTPLLNKLHLTFRDPIRHTQQLYQFFARTEGLTGKPFNRAQVVFDGLIRKIILGGPSFDLEVEVDSSELSASMITRVHGKFSSLIACVERLDVQSRYTNMDDLDPAQLLGLFRQFSAVQSLYVSVGMKPLVGAALKESTSDRAKEVLPALRELFLESLEPSGSLWEAIQSFVATRQLSDRPVTVQHWEPKSLKWGA